VTEAGPLLVLITAGGEAEARRIADALLEERLAACVNTIRRIDSRYWWRARLESARECLLLVKTRAPLLPAIIERVKGLHSYEVPEIIALPIAGGNPDYLKWLEDETQPK
jgi:periplasmic divalent cation tolerance protein